MLLLGSSESKAKKYPNSFGEKYYANSNTRVYGRGLIYIMKFVLTHYDFLLLVQHKNSIRGQRVFAHY